MNLKLTNFSIQKRMPGLLMVCYQPKSNSLVEQANQPKKYQNQEKGSVDSLGLAWIESGSC